MPDLIEKFYREDLTEAEEQELGGMLSSSEDAAEKFGTLAEEAYYRFGHPKPEWPGGDSLPKGKGGLKPWFWLALLAAAGGAALWVFLHRPADPAVSVPAALQPMERLAQVTPPKRGTPKPKESVPRVPAEGSRIAMVPPVGKSPEKGAGQVPEPKSLLTPVNLDENPGLKFSSISVKINQAQAGKVRVRVLDMGGLEITPLYEGNLRPGHWIFDWDGKLGDGKKVAPGYYQIEVKSGTFTGHKNIRIQ